MKNLLRLVPLCLLLILAISASAAAAQPLRLFIIGNSFSRNAAQYLPQLAKEGGHELIIGRAEISGGSLSEHWAAVEAEKIHPNSPKAHPYLGKSGKSLRELLSEGTWDVVTLQQASTLSGDIDSYRPYAENLYHFIKQLQPQAKVVFHETWPYRSDSTYFTRIDADKRAQTQQEMWQYLHDAYYRIARELNMCVIPNGAAFWNVASDPQWAYHKDPNFDFANPVEPALPDQTHSLNVGYRWVKGKLKSDTHHANAAGCYLGALVWYGSLFNESPEKLSFVPKGVPADFAAHLRKVAWQTVKDNKMPLKSISSNLK